MALLDAAEAHNDWLDRLSLDWRSTPSSTRHTLSLFQEWGLPGALQHLDIRLWFDELRIFNLAMNMVPLADSSPVGCAGGTRSTQRPSHRRPRNSRARRPSAPDASA